MSANNLTAYELCLHPKERSCKWWDFLYYKAQGITWTPPGGDMPGCEFCKWLNRHESMYESKKEVTNV